MSEPVVSYAFNRVQDGVERIMNTVERRLTQIEDRIISKAASALLLVVGFLVLIYGGIYYLIESLGWSRGASFALFGAIIIVTGFTLRSRSK
ncbi:hypothetical protein KW787_01810 [Candidatus Pacearchaeota archaeon]|nr:hypothetical protein [Candidatus Pacearchaeota archaeon]